MLVDGARVLVCDLDGTLVRRNTFPYFVRSLTHHLLAAGRGRDAVRLLASLAGRKLGRRDHGALKRVVCELAATVPEAWIAAWVAGVWDADGNDEVAAVVRAWDGVTVLSTAAPEAYASMFASQLGFDHVQGSVVVDASLHDNEGEAKCARLRQLVTTPVAVAISDDPLLDGPLFALARRAIHVVGGRLHDPGADGSAEAGEREAPGEAPGREPSGDEPGGAAESPPPRVHGVSELGPDATP